MIQQPRSTSPELTPRYTGEPVASRASFTITATRRGVIAYLLIAFAFAWSCWEIPIRLGLSVRHPMFQFAVLPGAFGPAIAAVLVRMFVTREGFADAGLPIQRR